MAGNTFAAEKTESAILGNASYSHKGIEVCRTFPTKTESPLHHISLNWKLAPYTAACCSPLLPEISLLAY